MPQSQPVTYLPTHHLLPIALKQLSAGAQLLVQSVREWVLSAQLGRSVGGDLLRAYSDHQCFHGLELFDYMMNVIARDAVRDVQVLHPDDQTLGADELAVLRLIELTKRDSSRHAQRIASRMVRTRSQQLCAAARAYREELESAGLTLSGWSELRLVKKER
ncbi:MAG: hypothetical protein AAGA91_06940 [Pseudomonadota bacterium]